MSELNLMIKLSSTVLGPCDVHLGPPKSVVRTSHARIRQRANGEEEGRRTKWMPIW